MFSRVRLFGPNKRLTKIIAPRSGCQPHAHPVRKDGTGPPCKKGGTMANWEAYTTYIVY